MSFVLTQSRALRFGSFSAFYFAQGVPIGLLSIAIPAWLGERGASQGEVGFFLGAVGLPWALKLLVGPFMDRFTFLPMGFRRPWVIILQGGLVLSLLALAVVGAGFGDGVDGGSLVALTAAGVVVNTFAATQDVAVDGMAIDVLPEDERGRANAFMGFGQRAASSMFGAFTGTLLTIGGIATGALACAAAVAVVLLLAALLRERPEDRLMPWSEGTGSPRATAQPRFFANLVDVGRVLVLPMSLLAIAVEFIARLRDGMAIVVFPLVSTQRLGFTTEQYTWFVGLVGFIAAAVVVAAGPAIDRFGAKRTLMIGLLASAALHLLVGAVPAIWEDTSDVLALYCVGALLEQLIFVSIIALFMNLCASKVAATQFAVYMALANLGRSTGAWSLGFVDEYLGFFQDFLVMGGLLLLSAGLLALFNAPAHSRRLAVFEAAY